MAAYERNRKALRPFMRQLLELVLRFQKGGRLLEIGSGAGIFLELAREKFEINGLELSRGGVALSERTLGAGVVEKKSLKEAGFPDSYFEAVVMNHVLEHILEPHELLADIKRVLKPGGVLVIGSPNFGGGFARWRKDKWPGLRPGEHIWQFEPQSLKMLLEKNGFEILALKEKSSQNLRSVFHFAGNFSVKGFFLRVAGWLFGIFGRGDNLLVVARKRGVSS